MPEIPNTESTEEPMESVHPSEAEVTFYNIFRRYQEFLSKETEGLTEDTMTPEQIKRRDYTTYLNLYLARMMEIRESLKQPESAADNKVNATREPIATQFVYRMNPPQPVVGCFSVRHPDLPDMDTIIITQRDFMDTALDLTAELYTKELEHVEASRHWLDRVCSPVYEWRLRHVCARARRKALGQVLHKIQDDPNYALEVTESSLLVPGVDFAGFDDSGNPMAKVDDDEHWVLAAELDKMRELRSARIALKESGKEQSSGDEAPSETDSCKDKGDKASETKSPGDRE